jgi:hypothetical protein
MIVVEGGAERIGSSVNAIVTNSLQTSAGRMIFARLDTSEDTDSIGRMASAATHQPRTTGRGPRGGPPPDGRNPRRS